MSKQAAQDFFKPPRMHDALFACAGDDAVDKDTVAGHHDAHGLLAEEGRAVTERIGAGGKAGSWQQVFSANLVQPGLGLMDFLDLMFFAG